MSLGRDRPLWRTVFCFLILFSWKSSAYFFREELDRSSWDQGCPDWPVVIPDPTDASIRKNPDMTIEKGGGVFRVYVKMTVTASRRESEKSLLESTEKLLANGFEYPKWVMPGLNEKVDGGTYFVTVDQLNVSEREGGTNYVLGGPYTFHILWFKREGYTGLEMRHDRVAPPRCPVFSSFKESLKHIVYRMNPREDIIRLLMADVWVLPQKMLPLQLPQVELRMRLVARPAPLVYALLPEALMRSEIDARGRRIFENFLELRRSLAVTSDSIGVAQKPKAKSEVPSGPER